MDENFNSINPETENAENTESTEASTETSTETNTETNTEASIEANTEENTETNTEVNTPPPSYYPPVGSAPYAQQQQFSPYQQNAYTAVNQAQPTKNSKKKKLGKAIFITLVCCSIIFASLAVGFISNNYEIGDNDPAANSQTTEDAAQGAIPTTEDTPTSYSQYSGEGAMTPEQVYQAVKDINVGILVYSQNQSIGEGSGIVVGTDKAGDSTYILTAAHVISDSNVSVQVQFNDGSEYDAEIVGVDEKTDVGVLKINEVGFTAATFGNSDSLMVGQTVYAIGNPGGTEFFGSFTSGLISAIDRPVPTSNSSYDLPCIQHNAAINPGNSGGALVNQYGQVIGLNSSKISSTEYEGMGFSVPANTVIEVYNEIITYGYVTNRPMLGILYFPVSSDYTYSAVAWQNNLPYGSVVISTINPSSDLSNYDVEVGDIITAVNGKELTTTDILLEEIEKSNVGDRLTLTICKLNNNGTVNSTFDVKIILVEDKGDNTVTTQQSTETSDPFHGYFENF